MVKRFTAIIISLLFILLSLPGLTIAAPGDQKGAGKTVYLAEVKGTIEPGLAAYIRSSIERAEKDRAAALILAIDTFGGRIDAATEIKDELLNAKVPIIAYVENEAFSAGALITLAAEKNAMKPGSSIGAAEPRPAEEKIISAWRSELEATAEARGRDPRIAAAMADRDVEIKGLKDKGKILSLTANQSQKLGMVDYVAENRQELLTQLGLAGAEMVELEPGLAETVARFTTNPYISPLLLTLGIAGLIIEALTIGWGIAGTIGLLALGFYFGGHMLAGLTGWEAVLIFILGVIALVLEIFIIPGFGVAGVIGIGFIAWSVFLASVSYTQAIISLVFAILGTILLLFLTLRFMTKRNLWDRVILGEKQQNKAGYSSARKDLEAYRDKEGVALTPLRPAGTADFDGSRLDVVTEGDFINAGARVKVVNVEGTRVIVRCIL